MGMFMLDTARAAVGTVRAVLLGELGAAEGLPGVLLPRRGREMQGWIRDRGVEEAVRSGNTAEVMEGVHGGGVGGGGLGERGGAMEWPRRHEVRGAVRGGDLNQEVEVR